MSQTTFLDSVVEWDRQKCQDNVDEALPKLINCFRQSELIQEQVGILKIICQSFLPCVNVLDAEEKVFQKICSEACEAFDKLVDNIREQTEHVKDLCQVKENITALLDTLMCIVDCIESCLRFVQDTEHTDADLQWKHIHSLPKGTIHVLKGAYSHCKESGELYGEFLSHVSDPLSTLFRKAHSLQSAFIHLLEKVTKNVLEFEQDIQDLCLVCDGLFEICQIVTSLDMKLVITLWKILSKYSVQHKDKLKDRLDIDRMIEYLCTQIQTGYDYLFQLVPHLDDEGMVLSQGDEKGFQKSIKILGFQMKIIVSLVRDYVDVLCGCEKHIYTMLIQIHKFLPPNLCVPQLQDGHVQEIRRHLVNATEPLMTSLLYNSSFISCLTSLDEVQKINKEECLSHLLLVVMVMGVLPKNTGEDVKDKWIQVEDERRSDVLSLIFILVKKCYVEVCLPVMIPGPMCAGKPQKDVSLFEYICTHFCGFVGSLPSKYFEKLECVLLENLLSTDPVCSTLAIDIWCFMGRYGTAELCYSHVLVLLELCQSIDGTSLQHNNVVTLLSRLMKFLATHHQHDILKKYPTQDNMLLWSKLPMVSLPSSMARDVVNDLCRQCTKNLHNFAALREKTSQHLFQLNLSLDCLVNILKNPDVLDKCVTPAVQSLIVDKMCAIWTSVLVSDWLMVELTQILLGKLFQLTGFINSLLTNSDLLKVFSVITSVLHKTPNLYLKLSIVEYLKSCGQLKFAPNFEQTEILKKLSEGFTTLLVDTDVNVHHSAIQAFTMFAEQTVHESVVPDCMQRQPKLQDVVVSYLNKVPHTDQNSMSRRDYLEQQVTGMMEKTDEEIAQPLLKRPRIDTDEESFTKVSNKVEQSELLNILRQCISELEQLPDSNTKQPLPNQIKQTLKTAEHKIGLILAENG